MALRNGTQDYTPEDWLPASESDGPDCAGKWKCVVCNNGRLFDAAGRRNHERRNTKHQFQKSRQDYAPPTSRSIMEDAASSLLRSALPQARHAVSMSSIMSTPQYTGPFPQSSIPPSSTSTTIPDGPAGAMDIDDFDAPLFSAEDNILVGVTPDEAAISAIAASYEDILLGRTSLWLPERLEDELEEDDPLRSPDPDLEPTGVSGEGRRRARNTTADESERREWYPWDDKLSCTLDILAHLPRSVFSGKQLDLLFWLLSINGVDDVPSVRQMKDRQKSLHDMIGINTVKFDGSFGHPYYVNDIGHIIGQEMANPLIRPHLHFYPEEPGQGLRQAWEAARWREKIDGSFLTPMIRLSKGTSTLYSDYYIHEPTMLVDGSACIPHRWFRERGSGDRFWGLAHRLELKQDGSGGSWVLREDINLRISQDQLLYNLPDFEKIALQRGMASPHKISYRVEPNSQHVPTTRENYTNPWRIKAKGRRVLSFLIWLYCDDTSGNMSKKWNKHNSFLFTPAGLPRQHVHQEYNVHFLCTSNKAPPLEMLEGIESMMGKYQDTGIECWDTLYKEEVLVLPDVLALLGDNPMQSELACHSGLAARLFCRICWVTSEKGGEEINEEDADLERDVADGLGGRESDQSDRESNDSVASGADTDSINSSTGGKKKGKAKALETLEHMVDRVKRFVTKGKPRTKSESISILQRIYATSVQPGGITESKKMRTESGLKDRFAEHFTAKLQKAVRGKSGEGAAQALAAEIAKLPKKGVLSPVWRIRGLDPHASTPVEILHVFLLGFLKYFWRDVITRLDDRNKERLIARLSSVNTRGLGIPPIGGRTLVQYCGSLTGRDFRVISQAAPFVLYGLDLPADCIAAWIALTSLVPLAWQPEIEDLEPHLLALENAIQHFLRSTAKWTPRWFNKPKFHILVHLVDHIRDFGPASLFATEAFESFNALIRARSVHSNRQAPSRDIAWAFAQSNRLRHLISGGTFLVPEHLAFDVTATELRVHRPSRTPSSDGTVQIESCVFRTFGRGPALLSRSEIVRHYTGIYDTSPPHRIGSFISDGKPAREWSRMRISRYRPEPPADLIQRLPGVTELPSPLLFKTGNSVVIPNGDKCVPGDWVLLSLSGNGEGTDQVPALLAEIIQIDRSSNASKGLVDFVAVQVATFTGVSPVHFMPTLKLTPQYSFVDLSAINCSANVQHNCAALKCKLTATGGVREEWEVTQRRKLVVLHNKPVPTDNISPWILNTAKMRDARYIQRLRVVPPALELDRVVHEGALKELNAQRASPPEPSFNQAGNPLHATPAPVPHSTSLDHLNRPLRIQQILTGSR